VKNIQEPVATPYHYESASREPESKLIVFTQFRDTADLIVDGLKNIPSATPVRFVGQATRNMDDIGLKQEQQVQILDDFKTGRYNVLVTTSIGEEGLHVPDVDHVIFYEAVPSEIRISSVEAGPDEPNQERLLF